jgi:hypothetical protein
VVRLIPTALIRYSLLSLPPVVVEVVQMKALDLVVGLVVAAVADLALRLHLRLVELELLTKVLLVDHLITNLVVAAVELVSLVAIQQDLD